tara:strand:- start:2025 stop:2618 length:594 start_codon:yes stop_codon:yes gene_type:complete
MFSGIIEGRARLLSKKSSNNIVKMQFEVSDIDISNLKMGASVAVNGVCLTAIEYHHNCFSVEVSNETLSVSNLGLLNNKDEVNIERSLKLGESIDGHFVFGHVDEVAEVTSIQKDGASKVITFKIDKKNSTYLAKKGSIAINGVSLTVNQVLGNSFEVTIIPHTLERTIMDSYEVGSKVNIEYDMLARYVESVTRRK